MSKPIWLMIYITLLHLGPALHIFGMLPGGRVYVFTSVGNAIALLFTMNYLGRASSSQRRSLTLLDTLVTSYLVWSICSILLYFQDNSPTALEGYFHGIHDFTLPICGYFLAKYFTSGQLTGGLRYIVLANAVAMLLGIYLYYQRPDFYTTFLQQNYFSRESGMEMWQLYARMQSYFGSTAVGIVSGLSIVLIRLLNPPIILAFAGVGLFCTSALLSMQRGGMAATAIALIYFLVFNKGRRFSGLVVIGLGLLFSLFLLNTVDEEHGGLIEKILDRTTEVSGIYEARGGYVTVWDYISEFPFGSGIGASGASSDGLQDKGKVVDANFMRILADLGIQGLALFLVILVAAGLAASKRNDRMGWLTLLFIYFLVASGTNTLDSHYVSHLFWVLLAVMDTPETQHSKVNPPAVKQALQEEAGTALQSFAPQPIPE